MLTPLSCFPCTEEGGGELCFLSSVVIDKQIKCNPFGQVSLDGTGKGWGVWRFTQVGEGRSFVITSWTHDSRVLSSNPDGHVFTMEIQAGKWERWKLEKKSENGVLIRSLAHHRVLCVTGETLETTQDETKSGCLWSLDPANCNVFCISSKKHGKCVSCNRNKSIFLSESRKASEAWTLKFACPGFVTIASSAHGVLYLAPLTDGSLAMVNEPHIWHVEPAPQGDIKLCSSTSNQFLACHQRGHEVVMSLDGGDDSMWTLEPRMPTTLTGKQIKYLSAAGVVAVGSVALAPIAVTSVIGAIGFGAEGIGGGSIAAWLMALYGGAVPAGGMVATLQSIGAAGLGVAGTNAAMTGGAVVGGTAYGLARAAVHGKGGTGNTASHAEKADGIHLPLAAWKDWEMT